jgi:hypothetical protein
MHEIQPTVGQWYLRPETGQRFEVIDIDDGDGMIEIQDEEGTLDQVDSDIWFTEAIELTNQPQHFTGALDGVSEPDEADGGDPVESDMPDVEPLRVDQQKCWTAPTKKMTGRKKNDGGSLASTRESTESDDM